jgi:hypothetical protein
MKVIVVSDEVTTGVRKKKKIRAVSDAEADCL